MERPQRTNTRALEHLSELLQPDSPLADNVTFEEARRYIQEATQAEQTAPDSKERRSAARLRRSLEPPTDVQKALWLIPTAAVLGFIAYLAGNEGLQAFTAWQHYQQAQEALGKLHYDLNPFNDISVLRQQASLLSAEAQDLTNTVIHGVKTAVGTASEAAGAWFASKVRPKRRGRIF